MKIGRNAPCPCGSGKKYKNCCYLKPQKPEIEIVPMDPKTFQWLRKIEACDNERRRLYGGVRPIIHVNFKGSKFVAVGNELYYSENWKTFPDFLISYIVARLGKDWVEAELKKPLEERHQIMQWEDSGRRFMQKQNKGPDGIYEVVHNGAVAAYLLLAYDLYVLKDNQALQEEIIRRLKISDQFQGARHELFATATCIRAGFTVEFEDERDRSRKHPEFIATHKRTGQKIAVEAKSKHRKGVLGYQGVQQTDNSIKLGVTSLINKAMKKNIGLPLVVFVDTNLPPDVARNVFSEQLSNEVKKTFNNLERHVNGTDLFNLVVFTNHPHQYELEDEYYPQKQEICASFSIKPHIVAEHNQCILDLYTAVSQHGNIPNEFPQDFNK